MTNKLTLPVMRLMDLDSPTRGIGSFPVPVNMRGVTIGECTGFTISDDRVYGRVHDAHVRLFVALDDALLSGDLVIAMVPASLDVPLDVALVVDDPVSLRRRFVAAGIVR